MQLYVYLQLLEILGLIVHLNFKCVDLEKLSTFLCLVLPLTDCGVV